MLTIICGEDTISSRNYYYTLKTEYSKKEFETYFIQSRDIENQIIKTEQTVNLFSTKIIYFTQNLNSYLSKASKSTYELFESIAQSKDVVIIDWEEAKSIRELRITKLGIVKEFKPQKNIFQLLDACYPSNKINFLNLLDTVYSSSDEVFIFTMLTRHIRNLILARSEVYSKTLATWQRGKLRGQTNQWSSEKLIGFYESLARIDRGVKTSSNPYGIKRSLDIVACYYL